MKTFFCALILASTLTAGSGQNFLATLNGAQDGGGGRQGSGVVTLTLTGTTLSLSGSFSGLSSPATLGHIHGPGAPGVSAAVIYDLLGTGVIQSSGTFGTYNGSVNLMTLGSYTLTQQLADLNNGLWYLNIHDSTFPGGEIRGQILPVPEPGVWALGGLGVFAYLVWKRRK